MTTDEHYNEYRLAALAVDDAKARLPILRKQGELAALRAKEVNAISGAAGSPQWSAAMKARSMAMKAAWEPFREQIAQVEQSIASNRAKADWHFDAWRGLASEMPV